MPPTLPPLPIFEAGSQNFASPPSAPRGFKLEIFGPPSAGTIGGPKEEGGPSQNPQAPLLQTPPPLLKHPCTPPPQPPTGPCGCPPPPRGIVSGTKKRSRGGRKHKKGDADAGASPSPVPKAKPQPQPQPAKEASPPAPAAAPVPVPPVGVYAGGPALLPVPGAFGFGGMMPVPMYNPMVPLVPPMMPVPVTPAPAPAPVPVPPAAPPQPGGAAAANPSRAQLDDEMLGDIEM